MKIDFGTAVRLFFKKYATFTGRATRAEYWWAMLFLFLVGMVLSWLGSFGSILSGIFSLACILPQLSISCRRLHDSGLSGWVLGIFAILYMALAVWIWLACGSVLYTMLLAPETLDPSQLFAVSASLAWPSLCLCALGIVWIVLMCRKSDGDNQYGPANGNMPSPEE